MGMLPIKTGFKAFRKVALYAWRRALETIMKDQLALLVAGVVCAVMAGLFWRFLDADVLNIIASVVIVTLSIDNRRLRIRLREGLSAPQARSGT